MSGIRLTEASPAREPACARPEGVLGLVLLLAVTGSALAAFAGAPDPGRLPGMPSFGSLEVLARSPNPPLDGVVALAVLVAWLVWGWAVASVAIELALALAEQGPAHGAAWLRSTRAVADRLTLPVARRAVAAAIVVQLATRPALPALAFASEPSAFVTTQAVWHAAPFSGSNSLAVDDSETDTGHDIAHHVVQRGETLWSIAERYYGTGEEFERVIDANIGKQMPDGRVFDRAAMIYPGWTLDIPPPSPVIEERDGAQWYVVQRGDTLSGIAARQLGDPDRYPELFELNVGARLGNDGPSLRSPDLIWPELRLRLPVEVEPHREEVTQPESSLEVRPEPTAPSVVPPLPSVQPAAPTAAAEPVAVPPASGNVEPTDDGIVAVITPAPTPSAEAIIERSSPTISTADVPRVDSAGMMAVAGAAVALAGVGLAGARVLRRRRHSDRRDEPSIALDQGFAQTDPARILGQRLAGETDAATEIANRLGRSFAAVLTANVSESEQSDVFGKVVLVAVRHGESSTTCVLSAPPVARGHLLRHLEAAVTDAFGDTVDVEGVITHDGDLFVQLADIDQRRLRVAFVDDAPAEQRLWPEPWLLPLGLLYDRQTLYANWHALNHVLVAAPMGQAAETVLVGLLASLVARRPPAELALVTLASPRTLPSELLAIPHQLTHVVDPADGDGFDTVLEQLRQELDRRAMAGGERGVDVAIVIRELADIRRERWDLLDQLLRDGPRYRIHVLAASERPAAELAAACPGLDAFRTRLVLQTADEDSSQSLLGAAGAEELAPGGNMLLRLEARTPVRAHGFRVAPDHLARLMAMMEQLAPTIAPSTVPATTASVSTSDSSEAAAEPLMGGQAEPDVAIVECLADAATAESCNGSVPIELVPDTHVDGHMDSPLPVGGSASEQSTVRSEELSKAAAEREADRPRSDLLRQLDQAPLRMRCFGTRGVWFFERQIWPSSEAVEDTGWELVVLLGIYPVAGIQAETLADTIWDEDTPPDPGSVLRKRRGRLRQELKRLVPELELDALPTDPKGRVYRLDPRVIASDVHQFVELANWAKSLPRPDAIAAYEEALALYGGDLLESVAVPTYPWLYDGAAIATSLRPDYRRLQEEVRLRLADLYAAGSSDDELSRAVDLYTELTAERPDDDRRWISLLRVQGRRGDGMALEASIRKLRTALVELGQAEKPETARLPLSIQRVLEEVQSQLGAPGETAVG